MVRHVLPIPHSTSIFVFLRSLSSSQRRRFIQDIHLPVYPHIDNRPIDIAPDLSYLFLRHASHRRSDRTFRPSPASYHFERAVQRCLSSCRMILSSAYSSRTDTFLIFSSFLSSLFQPLSSIRTDSLFQTSTRV